MMSAQVSGSEGQGRLRTAAGRSGLSWSLPLLATALLLGCAPAGEEGDGDSQPDPAAVSSNDKNCEADPQWILAPHEADAENFDPTSNCSFHQWAYQNFLWLTSPDPGTGETIFENFANPKALFVPGGPTEPYPGRADDEPTQMLARFGKSRTTADVEDIFQAGPGGKVLVDQNGEVVFYSNHLDEVYWDFVVHHRLYDLSVLQAIQPPVPGLPSLDFKTGSLELKASWRVAEKDGQVLIPDADQRFYVVETLIPRITVDDQGRVGESSKEMIPARMALIGMHVTGTVKGHPEFIWATFEHVDNAPDCTSDPPALGPGPTGPWSLYTVGTATGACNQFDVSDPLAVVNVCLVHPRGGGSDENKNAVRTLNKNVAALPPNPPWTNYKLGGGVWTSGQVPVNNGAFSQKEVAAGAEQRGSLDLANTTMETFTQNENCFACHNGGAHEIVVSGQNTGEESTEVNAKSINLSHFVVTYQATEQVDGDQ